MRIRLLAVFFIGMFLLFLSDSPKLLPASIPFLRACTT